MNIILSTACHAPIQYYSKFLLGSSITIDPYETFLKQSYRNRYTILAADGGLSLSVPVEYSSRERTITKDVKISDHGNWQHTHWNAIISAYNSAPFFEYYKDDYERFYTTKFEYLFDYNMQLLNLTLTNLNIHQPNLSVSNHYISESGANDLDCRNCIHPKLDCTMDTSFTSFNYYQVFRDKHGFIKNLSILDLLFNMGNESYLVLRDSTLIS